MPWTFAHAAAVLPFRRFCPGYLSFSGLIIGSFTPDLGYYVGEFRAASFAHTFPGSVLLCLPSGVLVLFALYLARRPIVLVLPQPHRNALSGLLAPCRFTLGRMAIVASSIVLGAWTHIVWDSFTHARRWGTTYFELLSEPLFQVGAFPIPAYHVLQHLSTVLGVAVLAATYASCVRKSQESLAPHDPHQDRLRWKLIAAAAGISVAMALPLGLSRVANESGYRALQAFAFHAAVYWAVVFFLLYVAFALLHYAKRN